MQNIFQEKILIDINIIVKMRNFRYIILGITTASMTFIYCNRVAFAFTLICQSPRNSTDKTDYYLSDSLNVAWMFTGSAIGMCVGPLPFYYVYKLDTRIVYFTYGMLAVLSSALYPLADTIGFWPSFLCRFFAGFSQASQLHFTNEFVLKYASLSESSLFMSILLSTSQIAPLITMIMGGETCSSSLLGWQWTYYIIAFGSFASSLAFSLTYHDDLTLNKYLSEEERQHIIEGKSAKEQSSEKEPVPFKDVLTDLPIWSCLILFIAYYIGMINYQLYSPTFIKEALGYSIRETGYFSAIPNIFGIIIKIGLGKLIDSKCCGLSNKWRLAIPLIVLEAISAVSLFFAGFSDNRIASLIFLMTFASMHFFVPVICSRTIQLIGAQHAHFALNVNMVIAGGIQIVVPMLVVLIVPDNTKQQWAHLFYLITLMIVLTCGLYLFGTDTKPAKWTQPKEPAVGFDKHFEAFPRISVLQKENRD